LALVCLAIFPGVLSLLIYYRGLRGTPASAATLGELAFPLTGALIGYVVFRDVLSPTQWGGVVLLCATVAVMGTIGRRGRGVDVPAAPALQRSA
jgi:drug/metabolite transporter (DMT)-like permease